MTQNRHELELSFELPYYCTICKMPYEVEQISTNKPFSTCCNAIVKPTFYCKGSNFASREVCGLIFMLSFLSIWLACTTYSVLHPSSDDLHLPSQFGIYAFLVVMDGAVSLATAWFANALHIFKMPFAFFLLILYGTRLVYIPYHHFFIGRSWAFVTAIFLFIDSSFIVLWEMYVYYRNAKWSWRRYLFTNGEVMIGGKGPFTLRMEPIDLIVDVLEAMR